MVDDGIFISYRREGGAEVARICKEFLEGQGFRVFLDVDGLKNGQFDNQLLEQLDKHGHLLLVCSPGCLDRCSENNDWIRQEVAHAIKLKRNIVPLLLSQFDWPKSETLPEEMRELNRHNAFSYNHEHWDSIKGKFANQFRTGKLAVQTLPERFIQVFMPQLLKLMANRKGDVVPALTESDFFKVALENLLGGSSQGETRQMLEEIVQHPSKFANAVSAATANQSVDVQDAAKLYFGQVPGTLQQSLRRSGDRTGRTIPNDLPLSKPEDFLRLIPSAMPRFMPGQFPVTGTDLKLIAFLGKGGFGEVWRARHLDRPNDADVVLKFCIDERAARSLIKEVDLLKKIKTKGRHANIVDLLDTHLDCSPPCLEYEFVDGGDLAKLIDDRSMNPLTPKLSPKAVAQIIARIATPVAFAHQQNIVHRDLKPQNVLVRRTQSDLNSVNFKITDFGIGGLIRTEELKQIQTSSVSAGETLSKGTFTPIYSSRQQQQGASPDKRDDVFALGVIWYQLLINDLTKEAPSGGGWKVRLRANGVTDEMLALLEGCIESDLEDRIPDAQILVERLTKIISTRPVEPTIAQPVIAPSVQRVVLSPQIRPQNLSSVGTPEQANNNSRAVESASKYVQKIDAIRAENDASINAENEASIKAEKNAAVSRTLGIAGLICFVVPVLGLIMPSWGIVCAVKGINSQKRSQAVAGLRMCILGLLSSLILNVIYIGIINSTPQEGQSSKSSEPSSSNPWSFTVLEQDPDPIVVTDAAARARMTATRLPWKIRDTATGIVMLLVPPGEFMMGSPENEAYRYENETQHRVTISKAFYLSQTEIPQEVWQKVMGANPSEFKCSQNPVETVSWNDCQTFCRATGLRLPSEAEWEYACRAGTTTPFSFGTTITPLQVNYEGNKAVVCGSLPANPWGFREMHGNVWEWCQDGFSETASTTQAAVEIEIGAHVLRGGGWSHSDIGCRASDRDNSDPGRRKSIIGCRFARTAD